MIRARVDTSTLDMFVRNRVRLLIEVTDERDPRASLVFTTSRGSDLYIDPNEQQSDPDVEPLSPWLLDVPRDVAKAVYEGLREHFEPKDPLPTAGDRAYSDARVDIDRLHSLIERLVEPPTHAPTHGERDGSATRVLPCVEGC